MDTGRDCVRVVCIRTHALGFRLPEIVDVTPPKHRVFPLQDAPVPRPRPIFVGTVYGYQ